MKRTQFAKLRKEQPMPKQIKADLEQVVEAIVVEVEKFSSGLFDVNGDGFMYPIQNDYTKQKLRTALEQFVVESNEAVMDSIEKIIEDMEESAIFYDKLLQYETSEAIRHFLTRLKALRELTNKTQPNEH
jgi:hypothetical protein